jgi:transposase
MSNDTSRIEIITGRERRRRYSAEHKLQLVEETMQPGMTVSAVARLHGVSPSLLFKWRQYSTVSCLRYRTGAATITVVAASIAACDFRSRWRRRYVGRGHAIKPSACVSPAPTGSTAA